MRRSTGDYLIALAEATRDLGGSLMVLGSPKQRDLLPGVTYDQAAGYAVEVFRRVMPAIGAAGVDLCLEPLARSETNFLNTCAQAMELIRQVDHPRLKLHLDVKAQSSEPGATVPELIRRYRFVGGALPCTGCESARAGNGRHRFRPDHEGAGRVALPTVGLRRGFRFFTGRGTRPPAGASSA